MSKSTSIEKLRFMPGVFAALTELQRGGFRLVMVTNQDGLGTQNYPCAAYEAVHQFMIDAFNPHRACSSMQYFVCPHRAEDDSCLPQTRDWTRR